MEKFIQIYRRFDKVDEYGTLCAQYESANWIFIIGYDNTDYEDAKQRNEFNTLDICIGFVPKDRRKYPHITMQQVNNHNQQPTPYNKYTYHIVDNISPIVEHSREFDEIVGMIMEAVEEIVPEYFPKDATYKTITIGNDID